MAHRDRPPGLVIFDCDGVLVDSEPIANRVLQCLLSEHGARLSVQGCFERFRGTSRFAVEAYMHEQGLALPGDWAERFYGRCFEAFRGDLCPVEGAPQVVRLLMRQGVACCVASNGTVAKMKVTLGICGLSDWFQGRIHSAQEAGQSKPAPDVFLHAARAHGVAPDACVVIEDSASGIEAAARAGMTCLVYAPDQPDPPGRDAQSGAWRFRRMADLPSLLGVAGFAGEATV
jgi:beta-phosphoglucomutase-like phosphatase (HAD superfamily)